ncbi:ubiquinol oxidase subunit II [Xinfangfangia sp. D13-10-4-6]|uniref:ubiquinol oxidase subunit II n=1 Tax=Pseudogemmobacter hezensis TaxID=2737662 RepID=UPI00155699B8|nr:ubiquinol oxidase subunit II [Pseudogemmobacter hezensis]NPD16027.1 ubiquinol oxidase subunit II [Pseudogemmobacter hezensis]
MSALVALAGCKAEVLAPSGDVAARQRDLLVQSTLLMLLIIVPVMLLTVFFAWKYRSKNKEADYQPDWDHSTKLELVIWAVPLLLIICLGALTWVGTHLLDPYRPLDRTDVNTPVTEEHQTLKVEVVALDWKWLFIYPEQGIATVNRLVVPEDTPIEFSLTSSTVMNAFYIPSMAGMIYAMPGMETKLHGVMNEPGDYKGIASHFSGAGFSGMHFVATATDQAGFDAFVAETKAAGGMLDRTAYLELAAPSQNEPVRTYADVDPILFARVVNICVEDGKICMAEMMEIDAAGGAGHAGMMNLMPRYASADGRALAIPVLGGNLNMIQGFCGPDEEARMLTQRVVIAPREITEPGPMRGAGLTPPRGIFAKEPNQFSQIPPEAGAGKDF